MKKPSLNSSKLAYTCKFFEVKEDTLDFGGGLRRVYSNIQVADEGGVCIVALDDFENNIMIREFRHAVNEMLLSLPVGGADKGESLLEAAKKELSEEAGVLAKTWRHIGSFYSSPGTMDEKAEIFLAQKLSSTTRHIEDYEQIEVVKMPFSEAVEKVYSGKVLDAWAIIPIMMVKNYLEENNR